MCQGSASSEDSPLLTGAGVREAPRSTDGVKSAHAVLLGQAIALSLACANAASSTLENYYQIRVPTFQTGIVYFLLSFHLVHLYRRRRIKGRFADHAGCKEKSHEMQHLSIEDADGSQADATAIPQPGHNFPSVDLSLHTPWYVYLLLATLDVEANYLAMLSFQHTSLSSSMLLTSLSVLSTVLLRQLVFPRARYNRQRLLGVAICLVGGCLWLREEFYRGRDELDAERATEQSQMDAIRGDLLALFAACLYGLNDVCAEFFMKTNNDRAEYLGMLGFFGSIISFGIQVPLLEKDGVQELLADMVDGETSRDPPHSMASALFLLTGFVVLLCFFYTSVMTFLSVYDSTILNLSFQSCPLWAVVLTMVQKSVTNQSGALVATPPATFFLSVAMVVLGMFLYEKHSGHERRDGRDESNDRIEHNRCIDAP
ncbi:hypothetical protein ACHAXT_011550 [Thalassiosira profunda]